MVSETNYSIDEAFVFTNYNVEINGNYVYYPIYMLMFLSNDYINAENMETSLPDDYDVHVMDMFLYDSYSYDDYFTPEEIEEKAPNVATNVLNASIYEIAKMEE